MTEAVGAVSMELRLDKAGFNRDLQALQGQTLKPLTLQVRLDDRLLKQQLSGLGGSITLQATLDTSRIEQQLKGFSGTRTLKLIAQVDDRQLTALNRHLDLKQRHFAQVNNYFKASPLTPQVNFSQLDALSNRLAAIQSTDIAVNVRVNTSGLRSQLGAINLPITQKLQLDTSDIEKSLGNSVERAFKRVKGGGLLSGLGGILTAPLKLAGGAISTALGGLTLGVTQELSKNLGKGLSNALESALSNSVGSSQLLGEKVGGKLGSAVAQEFSVQTRNLAAILEQQIDRVSDSKLRNKLKQGLEEVKAAPSQARQALTGAIGQDEITREGLFQRGQQRQTQQAKTPVVREEAVSQFREAIATSKSVETRATQSKATLEQQIQLKQREVAEVGQRYEQLAAAIKQAEAGGAKTEELAPLASQLSATAQDFQALSQSLGTLVQAREIASNAVQEAKQKRVVARQQLDQVSPKQQPKAYTELARSVLGESFDEEKLPKLVVDEARLKASGAGSLYVPAENAIITTNKIYEAVKKASLTKQQADTLGEEIAHAEDFDFGSFKGIQAAKENRPIGRRVAPTNEEAARFAPELGRYAPEKREAELNAKVKGARGADQYLQRQDRLQVVSAASDVAVQGEKFTAPARKTVFKQALIALQQEASKRFLEADQSIDQFIGNYKETLSEIESISQRAAQSAGSATREEVAGLQEEMNAAIASLSGVFDSVGAEIRRVQAIAPEDALKAKQEQIAGLLKQFGKKELAPLAEQFGVQDVGSLKKKDLIQQIATTADPRQLEPQVFNLTRAKAQQQLERQEQRAAVAQTVGGVARGAVDLAGATASKVQDIASSAPVQNAVQAAGTAGKALFAVGKAGYAIASGMEALALDLIPAGRALKGVAQQTVVPAALFAGATALLPGGAGIASGLSHVVGGVASPLLHAAGAGATDAATGAIAGHLPNAFGLANGISTAITGVIDGAVNSATAGIAQAGAAILGGKAIQTAAGRTLGGATQAVTGLALPAAQAKALPPTQTKALPAAAVTPREGKEGLFQDLNEQYSLTGLREVAKRVGITSKRARSLKKEDLARELSSSDFGVPIDQVLAEVGDSAKLKAFQTGKQGTIPKLPAEALTSIKSGSEKLKQLYKQFQTAQGQQRLALARAIATESDQQVAAIDNALKQFQVEGTTAQQLAGLRTQLTQRSELPRTEAREAGRQQIQQTQRQGSASRAVQTVEATVVDRSSGEDFESANLLTSLRGGSEAVNKELGAAIERFNQAQHALAETISTQVARFAEIEPEATLPGTLKKAANTPKGRDLLVNTAGFAASVAGNHIGGPVGSVAGDLIGALTARHALSGGQHGNGDELFGDLAGFAVGNGAAALGNLVPGVAGIPFKGAAAAIATVPRLTKLRQRIQGRLSDDDEAKASGGDLESANLISGASGIKRTLTSKSRQLLSQLEKQLGDTIDGLALALSSDKDYAGSAGRQEIRALNQLNQTVERLLNDRAAIINETFDAEMTRANQELLQIGERIAAKTAARPDFGLLADRGIGDINQAEGQKTVSQNQQELRQQRRQVFEQERQGGEVADIGLVRVLDTPRTGGGPLAPIARAFRGVDEDIKAAAIKRAELLVIESKTLLNDIKTSQIAFVQKGDTKEAAKLGPVRQRTERAIAGAEGILSKPSVSGKEIAQLQAYSRELRGAFKILDRPAPSDPGGFASLLGVLSKVKDVAGPLVGSFFAFQGLQVLTGFVSGFAKESSRAALELDKLKTSLDFASGSSTAGSRNLEFVRKTVDDLKIPLASSEQGFSKLAAATRGTSSEGQTTRDVFLGISQASTVLGLSADDTSGSLLALTQIASKGTVQAEELRGQLGERIPGAFSIAARAMGVTEGELNKLLETGSVASDEFLPKFARQLQTEFGGAAVNASKNAQSALFDFQNTYLKLQETTGKKLQPFEMVGLNLATAGLNLIADKGGDIAGIFTNVGLILGLKFLAPLLQLPGIASLASGGFFQIGFAIGKATSFLGTFLAKFLIINAAIEVGKTIFSNFLPSELGNQFSDFGDQAVESLKRVKVAAGETREEVGKVGQKGLKPQGFDLTLGLGGVAGLKDGFRTDTVVEAVRDLPGLKQARQGISAFTGGAVQLGTTNAEAQFNRDKVAAGTFATSAQEVVGRAFDANTIANQVNNVADLDKQQAELQRQRKKAASLPNADKNQLATLDQQIAETSTKRQAAAAPILELQGAIDNNLKNAKASIEAIDAAGFPADKAKELKDQIAPTVGFLEKAQQQLTKLQQNGKGAVDPARQLLTTFEQLNAQLEEAGRSTEKIFKQRLTTINQQQLQGFGTDRNASQNAAVAKAQADVEKLQSLSDQQRTILDKQKEALQKPGATELLSSITIDDSGKSVSLNSNQTEIEQAKKRLGPKDGKQKQILENLKSLKDAEEKQSETENQLGNARLNAQQAVEAKALKVLQDGSKARESQVQRGANTEIAAVKTKLALRQTDEETAAIDLAKIAEATTDKQIGESARQLEDYRAAKDAGKISAEQLAQKELELTDRVSQLKTQKAEQELAVREAVNRKILVGLELVNRKAQAAIQLSATNATTAVKQRIAAGGTEDNAPAELNAVQTVQAKADVGEIQKEIVQNRELAAAGTRSKKEATEKALELNQRLAEANQKVVDLEIDRQKVVRDFAIKGIEDRIAAAKELSDEQIAALDREKVALVDLGQKALEINETLLKSKSDLQQALDQLAATKLEIRVKQSDEAIKLGETLKDKGATSEQKKVARRQLGELGFGSSAKQGDLADEKLNREQALAAQKQAALLREESLQRVLLEFEIKKQEFAAKSAQFEARKNVLLQEQAILQAKLKLDKAKELAPGRERDRAIAEASSELGIAQKGLGNAQELSGLADQQVASLGENAQLQRSTLGAKQQNDLLTFQSDQQSKLRQEELDRAGVKGRRSNFDFQAAARTFSGGGPIIPPLETAGNRNLALQGSTTPSSNFAFSPPEPDFSRQSPEPDSNAGNSFQSELISFLGQKLDALNANIVQLANTPRSLAFHSEKPVDDYADFQNRNTGNLLRA